MLISSSLTKAVALPARALLIASLLFGLPLSALAAPACAHDVSLVFLESAPRDRFEIRNDSSLGQRVQRVTLDLAGSAGRLIFDTTEGGAGVNVFQPFRVESGDAQLDKTPVVQDGSERLDLVFTRFESGERFAFSIDVDDRLTSSDLGQIRIAGAELKGALLTVVVGPRGGARRELQARVDDSNRARAQASCP
jgi:hypothetical protein